MNHIIRQTRYSISKAAPGTKLNSVTALSRYDHTVAVPGEFLSNGNPRVSSLWKPVERDYRETGCRAKLQPPGVENGTRVHRNSRVVQHVLSLIFEVVLHLMSPSIRGVGRSEEH